MMYLKYLFQYLAYRKKIKTVLYALEINEQCPAYFDYIDAPSDGTWTTKRNETLAHGDRIAISVLVQYDDEVHKRDEILQFDSYEDFSFAQAHSTDILLSLEQCDMKSRPDPTCDLSETVMRAEMQCSDDLIFEEEFRDVYQTTLNPKYWSYDVSLRVNGDGDEEFVMFDKSNLSTFVRDDVLHILPRFTREEIRRDSIDLGSSCSGTKKEECSIRADGGTKFLPPITSAQISTKDLFTFKYGRVEVKAKLPIGDWVFPHIELRSKNEKAPYVFIAFTVGNEFLMNSNDYARENIGGNILKGGTITWRAVEKMTNGPEMQAFDNLKNHTLNKHYGEDFHVYTLTWNSTSLTFGVDDFNYGTIKERLTEEYYIVLGVSAGGRYAFADNVKTRTSKKPWSNIDPKAIYNFWKAREDWLKTWSQEALQVDYVRIYAL